MDIPPTTLLQSTSSSSSLTSYPTQIQSINNTLHITNTPSQSSNTLSSTLPVTSSTPSISDGTVSPPPPIVSTISSTSVTDSSTSNPSVTVSTEGTLQSSTGSNTLAAVLSTVFILLVVTILVILIVSVLVCRRRLYKTTNGNDIFSLDKRKPDINQQSDALRLDEGQNTLTASTNPAYGVTGKNWNTDVSANPAYGITEKSGVSANPAYGITEKSGISANPAYGIHNREGIESIGEEALVYDEPRTMMFNEQEDEVIKNEGDEQEEEDELYI
ncbi:PREDICTED: cell wall integrity and stress response component 4-like isoform X2 [Amphimedon queenslandica]|uniref:Uncharacterized protein n=1 Tax=Amphimedon queenslandica TaxID=400682 RepID=A0AAN0JZA1_AMPQE|nr:PREDICTED: cell wall integrity and stress response component 4-like isoform X2 [Amphimedon queenslandica]|eukprot:XP_019862438.1 PREDICTED: cell wall integrity and stress response component 4-like isoform X2 [Amphimedon queenslandica]